MRKLGIRVDVAPDPDVEANRLITVHGCAGKIPGGGTEDAPLELFVQNAGTAARFLTAMACLGQGVVRLSGVPRMHERPQKELIRALRALGYRIDTPNDKLPAVVHGGGPRPGPVTVSVDESSQFASALLLSSHAGGWEVSTPEGSNPDELPYVEMTRELGALSTTQQKKRTTHGRARAARSRLSRTHDAQRRCALSSNQRTPRTVGLGGGGEHRARFGSLCPDRPVPPSLCDCARHTGAMVEVFPHGGGTFQIEPDASSASYFYALNAMFPDVQPVRVLACQPPREAGGSGWQIDAEFPRLAPTAARVEVCRCASTPPRSGRWHSSAPHAPCLATANSELIRSTHPARRRERAELVRHVPRSGASPRRG
eukprot:2743748-Prymnesium_polylepis.1